MQIQILTYDELDRALSTCTLGTCFSDNCPLRDADYCLPTLLMNALMSGDRKRILRGIQVYEHYHGSNAFLNDVKELCKEDNNG